MTQEDEFRLNEITTMEYDSNTRQRNLVISALNDPIMQNSSYSFRCVNENILSRTYCMPTSQGSDVTVVVINPLIPRFSKVLISGTKEACEWHKGTLDELAGTKELNSGARFQRR
ncbi:hypothetical protein HYT23_00860 [Candidatus Pacearchaeota archaeon]|nr:hypothetical protein [Candidatus Pacearchaeota archaeon]